MSGRERPIRRPVAAAALLSVILTVVAVGAGLGQLRHTDRLGPDAPPIEIADPRMTLECAEAAPREGQEREAPADDRTDPALLQVELPVTSGALLDCPQVFDGRRVVFRGEAVGQVLGRGERVWLQVNDDVYAGEAGPLPGHRVFAGINGGLGVSLPPAEAAAVTWRGGPRRRGDQVEVRGVFRRVDPASGEMAVIVAETLVVRAAGGEQPVEERTDRAVLAYLLIAAAAGLTVVQRRQRER